MIRRGGAKEGKGELRDERDKRGSGVRVSSFDPLSLLRLCESRVLPTCPCFDSNESLPPRSPTVRRARARASARTPSRCFSLSFSPYPPPPPPPTSPPGGRRSRSRSRLSHVDSFRSPTTVPPPGGGTAVLVGEPRCAPATVTSLRVV